MDKVNCRQFIDEVIFMTRRKEFQFSAWKAYFQNMVEDLDEITDQKKIALNHLYLELFKKYGIVPDSIYDEMDKFWEASQKSSIGFWKLAYGLLNPGNMNLILVREAKKCWNRYLKQMVEFAKSEAKRNCKG